MIHIWVPTISQALFQIFYILPQSQKSYEICSYHSSQYLLHIFVCQFKNFISVYKLFIWKMVLTSK